MKSRYTFINTSQYISELKFSYLKTYSFQRGGDYDILEIVKNKDNSVEDRELYKKAMKKYDQLFEGSVKYLVDDAGQFHSSATEMRTFKNDSSEVQQLINILQIEAVDIPLWMCAPFYRDGVVFYDNEDNIVSTLNICFSCQKMALEPFSEVGADVKTYNQLKIFFIALGHKIESKIL